VKRWFRFQLWGVSFLLLLGVTINCYGRVGE